MLVSDGTVRWELFSVSEACAYLKFLDCCWLQAVRGEQSNQLSFGAIVPEGMSKNGGAYRLGGSKSERELWTVVRW